jgi:hypothetical integral membrane protein (TIGR02206 family)
MTPFEAVGFQFLSFEHITGIAAVCIVIGALALGMRSFPKPAFGQVSRILIAGVLVLAVGGELVLDIVWFGFNIRHHVPLHLCDVSLAALLVALLWRRQWFFEFAYYFGVPGAVIALLTPDIGEPGFSSGCFRFFFVHAASLAGVTVLIGGLGMRPGRGAPLRAVVAGHLYVLVAGTFNAVTGTNYGYLCGPPGVPSPVDYLGPWPWYLIAFEAGGLALVAAMSLPFARRWTAMPEK